MDHKITVSSPFKHAPDPERHAKDPLFQQDLLIDTFLQLLRDPFEASRDLRGATIQVILHTDGLDATAELLPKD